MRMARQPENRKHQSNEGKNAQAVVNVLQLKVSLAYLYGATVQPNFRRQPIPGVQEISSGSGTLTFNILLILVVALTSPFGQRSADSFNLYSKIQLKGATVGQTRKIFFEPLGVTGS